MSTIIMHDLSDGLRCANCGALLNVEHDRLVSWYGGRPHCLTFRGDPHHMQPHQVRIPSFTPPAPSDTIDGIP